MSPLKSVALSATVALGLALSPVTRAEAPMTNADVLKMVEAKLPENTIVIAIQGATANFDVGPTSLIALNQSGVPQAVIEAMLQKSNGAPSASSGSQGPGNADTLNPEEILLVQGGETTRMRYMPATLRTASRAMGFGGFATYSVLNGPRANLRLSERQPTFVIAVPGNAQPDSYLTLASFAVRRNDTREVMVGGGYMTYSTGINRDRVIKTVSTAATDQSRAPNGFTIFEVRPEQPLAPGEYALVTYNSQVRVAGFFAAGADSYFDFGVD